MSFLTIFFIPFMKQTCWKRDKILKHALKTVGCDPKSRRNGGRQGHGCFAGGKRTAWISVGVLFGCGSREEMEEAKPNYIAGSIKELREFLLK